MNSGFIDHIADIGVRKNYQPWQTHLTRKINLSSIIGMCAVAVGLIVFLTSGYTDALFECLTVILLAPLVFVLNKKFNYIAAGYLFTFIGCFFFYFLCVKMGLESYGFLCYVPFNVALVQMFARKETLFHLTWMILMCVLSIILVLISFKLGFLYRELTPEIVSTLKYTNIFLSLITTTAFLIMICSESIKQENQLKAAVLQKETLLAELFHRVKNNLNIVNSLLNLKKGSVHSREAQEALEECRNLVFSMALVHNKIYTRDKIDSLNFAQYLQDLSKDLVNSLGGNADLILNVGTTEVNVDITHAIPCGLIINELMTNSFKHGRVTGRSLKLQIDLKTEGDSLFLKYRDNGPGISGNIREGSVGLDLVKALADQLDADYNFNNDEGMVFKMSFPYNQCAIN